MPPYDHNDPSLEATTSRLRLGYGDAALVAMQIMRCLEYELPKRDKVLREQAILITELQEWVARLERVRPK
jgi:hypothetical protein